MAIGSSNEVAIDSSNEVAIDSCSKKVTSPKILICWLALLLVRIIEVETGMSWDRVRREMDRLHFVELFGKGGRVLQRTKLTSLQTNILKKLKTFSPNFFQQINPA